MKAIRVKITDFEYGFDPRSNFLFRLLDQKYTVELSDDPELLIYSVWGNEHCNYDCVKIFYTAEAAAPDFNECDYAIGFDDISFDNRYMRLPLFATLLSEEIQNRERFKKRDLKNRKFCNFVYNNETVGRGAILRKTFCQRLMEYKKVDCPGYVLHNMESEILGTRFNTAWYQGKLDFIKDYKFTIAFENSFINGYTTEKLIQPLMVGSIPIYFGNAEVAKDFNPKAFINAADYDNDFEAVIERIKEIDADDEKAMEMILCSPLRDDHWFDWKKQLEQFLDNILSKELTPFERFRLKKADIDVRGGEISNCNLYGTAILDEIKKYKKSYIYGDGLFGHKLAVLLKKRKSFVSISGFAVTDEKREGEYLLGKPVVPIKNIPVDQETLFLIAIREEDQEKLIKELRNSGWAHFIYVNLYLLNILENMA